MLRDKATDTRRLFTLFIYVQNETTQRTFGSIIRGTTAHHTTFKYDVRVASERQFIEWFFHYVRTFFFVKTDRPQLCTIYSAVIFSAYLSITQTKCKTKIKHYVR